MNQSQDYVVAIHVKREIILGGSDLITSPFNLNLEVIDMEVGVGKHERNSCKKNSPHRFEDASDPVART